MLPAETNYAIYDKELLAIVAALDEWPHFLMNTEVPFVIRTDHKSLEYFKVPQNFNQRQARWLYKLLAYNYKINTSVDKIISSLIYLAEIPSLGLIQKNLKHLIMLLFFQSKFLQLQKSLQIFRKKPL